jgi:integrase
MVEIRVRGVKLYKSRGKLYAYHRRTGIRIQAPLGTAAFLSEVERLNGREPPAPKPGTLGALIAAYRRSPEFRELLAERTRRDYQKVFDYLKPLEGDVLVSMTPAYVLELRDAAFEAHKRRFANYVLAVLRLLLKWGAARGFVDTNPAAAVPNLRRPRGAPRANRAWTDDEFEAVLAAAVGGLRLAVALGGFAGMREGDVVHVPPAIDDGKWLRWTQRKTGTLVELPVHPRLREILDETAAARADETVKPLTLVVGIKGRPYTSNGFQRMFFGLVRRLAEEGRVAAGLTFHGLRHTAGRLLADRGADPRTIAALLGHKTLQMAAHYSEEADRKKRAAAAVAKLRPRTKVSNARDKRV